MTKTQSTSLVPSSPSSSELGFVIDNEQAKNWYQQFVSFSKDILKSGIDFGEIVKGSKPSLLKAGAEKLRFAYGLEVTIEPTTQNIDLKSGLLDFGYVCKVFHSGKQIAACEGSANSYETKYRYVWVSEHDLPVGVDKNTLKRRGSLLEEFAFAIEKAETGGQYGKPAQYWQKFRDAIENGKAIKVVKATKSGKKLDAWRIEDWVYQLVYDNPMNYKNTLQKMAQKRAFVGAILIATGASEFFTQDLEDLDLPGVEITSVSSGEKKAVDLPLTEEQAADIMTCTDLKQLSQQCKQLQQELGSQYRVSIIKYYRQKKAELKASERRRISEKGKVI